MSSALTIEAFLCPFISMGRIGGGTSTMAMIGSALYDSRTIR
jgi:hypothetical protein